MTIDPHTITITGERQATMEQMMRYALRATTQREADTALYVLQLDTDCASVGYRSDVLLAQAGHECARFTSEDWRLRLNPVGLAHFDDSDAGHAFSRVDEAAHAHVVHMGAYVDGDRTSAWVHSSSWRQFDPRYQAVFDAGFAGVVDTLADLGKGRWATDPNYAAKVAGHLETMIGPPIVTPPTPQPGGVTVPIRVAITPAANNNRPGILVQSNGTTKAGKLLEPNAFTVHQTGNPNAGANAEMHRRFVHGGGGSSGVSFHWCVDDHEAVQLLPFNEQGIHAGNSEGNRTSEAMELCINSDGNYLKTLANGAQIIAMRLLARGWDVDRLVRRPGRHGDWPGANPNCPAQLNAGKDGVTWPEFVEMVRAEWVRQRG